MAPTELPPEAIPPDICFACHPKVRVGTVFCILCDGVYHKSDFNDKENSVCVICDKHPKDVLTSKDEPRVMIAIFKEEIMNLKKGKLEEQNGKIISQFNVLKTKYSELKEQKKKKSARKN